MNATDAYLIVCRDASNAVAMRIEHLDAHLKYVASIEARFLVAGVVLAIDQKGAVGSAMIVTAPDFASARRVATDDPYHAAGVWAAIEVMPYLVAFGNLKPKPFPLEMRIPGYQDG